MRGRVGAGHGHRGRVGSVGRCDRLRAAAVARAQGRNERHARVSLVVVGRRTHVPAARVCAVARRHGAAVGAGVGGDGARVPNARLARTAPRDPAVGARLRAAAAIGRHLLDRVDGVARRRGATASRRVARLDRGPRGLRGQHQLLRHDVLGSREHQHRVRMLHRDLDAAARAQAADGARRRLQRRLASAGRRPLLERRRGRLLHGRHGLCAPLAADIGDLTDDTTCCFYVISDCHQHTSAGHQFDLIQCHNAAGAHSCRLASWLTPSLTHSLLYNLPLYLTTYLTI